MEFIRAENIQLEEVIVFKDITLQNNKMDKFVFLFLNLIEESYSEEFYTQNKLITIQDLKIKKLDLSEQSGSPFFCI